MLRSLGIGRRGAKGETGAQGPAGSAGAAGAVGAKGDTGPAGSQGAIGSTGPKGDTGATGPKGDTGSVGSTGPAGSNASATPLSDATPVALAKTASAGSSTSAARGDHVHPLPTGRLEFIGNVTVSQTLLTALTAGMFRKALTLTGVTTADRLVFAALTPCASGCEALNVYATNVNEVTVAYNTPTLIPTSVINIPLAVYRIT